MLRTVDEAVIAAVQCRGVHLLFITEHHDLGAGSGTRDDVADEPLCRVLRLIADDIAACDGTAADGKRRTLYVP